MKFDGILFVSDIDGTLLNDDKNISNENIQAIKYFTENGGKFTVATGRTYQDLEKINEILKLKMPVICQNGARIYDFSKKENIFEMNLNDSIELLVDKIANKAKYTSIELVVENKRYVFNKNTGTKKHLDYIHFVPQYIDNWQDAPKPWARISMWMEPRYLEQFAGFLHDNQTSDDYAFMRTSDWSYEIVHKNADKSTGIEILKEKYKNIKFVAAIGDNQNDAKMIKNANLGFAPKNAFDEAKKSAKIITKATNETAVAEAILYLEKHIKDI